MKRYQLTDARTARGMSQKELADAIGADEVSIARWEHGTQTPYAHYIGKLCTFFGVKPAALNLDAAFNDRASTQCREDDILEMLKTYDRRQLLELLTKLPVFAGVDLTVLFSTTVVAPEKYLSVCQATIKGCWNLLTQNGNDIADGLLSACLPELESLAVHASPHRQQAALLAGEAKIIQMIIATGTANYARRVSLGSEAVRLGKMSGDSNMHALTLGWHGDTYNYCYRQPETAISFFTDALTYGDTLSPLNTSDIYISLAASYALNKNEKLAREYAVQAQVTMPEAPQGDPLYRLIELGQSELDRREGDMYLILAEKFPQEGYAKIAYDAFEKSTSGQAIDQRNLGYALIHKADAARGIGEMRHYLDCLEKGAYIALQMGIARQISKAVAVLQKAPMKWRNEQQYKELRNLLTPRISTARK